MKEHLLHHINQATSHSVRGLRILVEYFYAMEIFEPIVRSKIKIVSVFGSARTQSGTTEYNDAKNLGKSLYHKGYAVVTGASQGIMQAANEGVAMGILEDLQKKSKTKLNQDQWIASKAFQNKIKQYSVGLKISLPFEPIHNPFVGVYATFHYFMVRKFFFGSLSSAFIACEGGFGTRDELFEILTLVQTGKAPLMPIIYISQEPKHLTQDIDFCVKKNYISKEDVDLIDVVPDYKKAVAIVDRFYSVVDRISYDKPNTIEITLKKPLAPAKIKNLENRVHSKYAEVFTKGVKVTAKKVQFLGYTHKSYGILKHLIQEMS